MGVVSRSLLLFALSWLALGQWGAQANPTSVETTGTLEVVQVDRFENHCSELHYYLRDQQTGKQVRLRFTEKTSHNFRSGELVKVRGHKASANDNELEVAAANGESVQTLQAAPVVVTGEQHTLVMLINFTDATLECPASAIQNLMFTGAQSVDGLYQETSYGHVWVDGDVVGPFTINYSRAGACDYQGWANAADAAAAAQGVDLSQYNRKVYVIPQGSTCGWAGLGTIGGNPARSWIAYCDLPDVYAHELGHNLGMHHASTDTNNDGVLDDEYGDLSDFMGYGGVGYRQVNGAHKAEMGWLPSDKLLLVTASDVFQLAPLEADPTSTTYPQTLLITVPGSAYSYYLSYRTQVGYDSGMYSSYANRLNIHRYSSGVTQTRFIKALTDGTSFSDSAAGLVITQLSHNNTTVTIQISYGCAAAAPTLSFSPATQQGRPGNPMQFTFNLKNNDRSGCGSATFYLTPTVPAGWTTANLPSSVTVAGGSSTSTTLTVTPPADAVEGDYTISVNVTDNFYSTHTASASATCQLANLAPPSPTNLVVKVRRNQVRVKWRMPRLARGSPRIASYTVWRDGSAVAITSKRNFQDGPFDPGSSHTYSVTAQDVAGNVSSPSAAAAANLPILASR